MFIIIMSKKKMRVISTVTETPEPKKL